jgi:hypothetical protein
MTHVASYIITKNKRVEIEAIILVKNIFSQTENGEVPSE